MLPTDRLDFDLPPDLIATHPAEPRDASRLMVVSRTDPHLREHRRFRDLPEYLNPHDLLVRNTTTVLPARLAGRRVDSGGRVQGLFLEEIAPGEWNAMLRSNGKLREGTRIALHHPDRPTTPDSPREDATIIEIVGRADSGWRVCVNTDEPAATILARVGATPLPPYILAARRLAHDSTPDERDRNDYQTIYADADRAASIAAPTAGLHFTPQLMRTIGDLGVKAANVVLRVGAGTFAPVKSEHVEEHPIHSELITVPANTLRSIDEARSAGGRAVVVGTTAVRALESVPVDATEFDGPTPLLITPGSTLRYTDALITNFHLPRSTLLAMVSALFDHADPVARLLDHYNEAIREGYRFYSYGDAMLILP